MQRGGGAKGKRESSTIFPPPSNFKKRSSPLCPRFQPIHMTSMGDFTVSKGISMDGCELELKGLNVWEKGEGKGGGADEYVRDYIDIPKPEVCCSQASCVPTLGTNVCFSASQYIHTT